MDTWSTDRPIYKQIKERLIGQIIDGVFQEGDAVPSVRQCAVDGQINPLTVSRAYQELADEGVLEKRRGLGLFVAPNAKNLLVEKERDDFLSNQWPNICDQIQRLGLSVADLIEKGKKS